MVHTIPVAASEYLSVDNLPTGSVHLLIRRHEMPDKMCVERYWDGLEKPEKMVYVLERTAPIVRIPRKSHVAIGHYECGGCGTTIDLGDRYCKRCGALLTKEEA